MTLENAALDRCGWMGFLKLFNHLTNNSDDIAAAYTSGLSLVEHPVLSRDKE